MTRVLLVDDEVNHIALLRDYLEQGGYEVATAEDGSGAIMLARAFAPDLIVLDLMLPGIDGLEICRQIRQFSDTYIMMLTARAEEIDKLVGLGVGADDYVTKPFSPREVIARIKAMLRRPRGMDTVTNGDNQEIWRFSDLTIDRDRHEVTVQERPLALTVREFDLLVTMAEYPERVFTRTQLLERVWGDAYYDDHVVDVHVANLRKKLEADPSHPRHIETLRGVGYRFRR
jgi:two-component system, OmpR family, alkaline phosphatase synthesis response regulator PhoP